MYYSGWNTLRFARLASGGNPDDIDFRNEATDDEAKDDDESDTGYWHWHWLSTEVDDVQCATDAMLNTGNKALINYENGPNGKATRKFIRIKAPKSFVSIHVHVVMCYVCDTHILLPQ